MKHSLQLLRISVAIVLTMVLGLLPHHHHHGSVCLFLDECITHQHTDNCPDNEEHPLPCHEDSCNLEAMKFFTQVERQDEIRPIFIDIVLADETILLSHNYISHHHRITHTSYPLHSGSLQKHYLRGPPIC